MHLPWLLSDVDLEFATSLGLLTFEWKDRKLIMRLTLTFEDGRTIRDWYRVFPPDGCKLKGGGRVAGVEELAAATTELLLKQPGHFGVPGTNIA